MQPAGESPADALRPVVLSTSATLRDAQQFVAAVQQAHGRVHIVLANSPLPATTYSPARARPAIRQWPSWRPRATVNSPSTSATP